MCTYHPNSYKNHGLKETHFTRLPSNQRLPTSDNLRSPPLNFPATIKATPPLALAISVSSHTPHRSHRKLIPDELTLPKETSKIQAACSRGAPRRRGRRCKSINSDRPRSDGQKKRPSSRRRSDGAKLLQCVAGPRL